MLGEYLSAEENLDVRLPEVQAERCVHSQLEQAGCSACLKACPRGAWVMDEDMLGIDPDRCDGCDLCVPACPQGAIQTRFAPVVKQTEKGDMAFALCERAGVSGAKEGLMPCVHAIGMGDLLKLQRLGVSYLFTASGNCDTCERGGAQRLAATLNKVNRLLSQRGMPILHYRGMAPQKWLRLLITVSDPAQSRAMSRRALFRGALNETARRTQELLEAEVREFRAPGELLPDSGTDAVLPFVPVIDISRCNGCDACGRLCPQQAIELEEDGHAYGIEAARCTGCGVCRDVCERQAVQVRPMALAVQTRIPLYTYRCRACGAGYHVPEKEAEPLCRICRQTNHHARLYQVLASPADSGKS